MAYFYYNYMAYYEVSWQDVKHLSLFFTELKPFHLSYSIYKHDAIDFADLCSMQDTCHIIFVIGLAHREVYARKPKV